MLTLNHPKKVKLICGFIYKEECVYTLVKTLLTKKYGSIDFESSIIPFTFTNYYCKETGHDLLRRFISFEKLIAPRDIVKIKLYCIKLERKYAPNKKRKINIDPGYIHDAKLVLSTTKDFSHRIYLDKGIYAEVTLYYTRNTWTDLPWTFPDYRTPEYKTIFQRLRTLYLTQIKLSHI